MHAHLDHEQCIESVMLKGPAQLTRYDSLGIGRLTSENQMPLSPQFDPPSYSNDDQVYLFSGALYVQSVTHRTPTIRTVFECSKITRDSCCRTEAWRLSGGTSRARNRHDASLFVLHPH
jgi:hypothetical protein